MANNQSPNNGSDEKRPRSIWIALIVTVAIILLISSVLNAVSNSQYTKTTYSDFLAAKDAGQLAEVEIRADRIVYLTKAEASKPAAAQKACFTGLPAGNVMTLVTELYESGVKDVDVKIVEDNSTIIMILYYVIMGAVIFLMMRAVTKRLSGDGMMGGFNKNTAKVYMEKQTGVTFKDVAGQDEAKESLQEIIDFLHNPQKYTDIGAKLPKGALLVGPPGTGKTLLAKAVAGEADVQFLSISGSDFVEMYVGVGASRVRDLFNQAKKIAPAIIFIDEIDAVGRKRGSGLGGGHDEREQTLNQMLVEMDGFDRTEGVIVLAATNRADILDPALLRPGRFDRQIYVGAPDCKGREEILKVHAKNKRLDDSVDLHTVALATSGFTGADLSNLMNEAAILAARENRPALNMNDLNEAVMKVVAGPEKRSRVRLQEDLRLTAIHEAGHAVAMYHLPTHDPVRQISIIPRGQALGLTWSLPQSESSHLTRNQMYEQIVGLLGGRVAEALFLGDISTGASSDIDRASKLARDMIARYGMDEALGTISYTTGDEVFIGRDYEKTKSYSEKIAGTIDERVKLLMDKAYAQCEDILKKDADKLHTITDFLLKHEVMSGKQFRECMEGKPIDETADTNLFRDYEN